MSTAIFVDGLLAWLRQQAAPTADLVLDSRAVAAGDVFFALRGGRDGREHVPDAVARGAAAIVSHAPLAPEAAAGVPVLVVPELAAPELAASLGEVAHAWYGRPSEALTVVAVTGTNGKTSCVRWLGSALNEGGVACATLGTLGATLPDGAELSVPGVALTTPDVLTLHRVLAAMRDAGAVVVALEASSIGLVQGRLAGVRIAIAGYTNLSHDHLDYHGTLDEYRRAKRLLFSWPGLRHAVLNIDDEAGLAWSREGLSARVQTYSLAGAEGAGLRAQDIHGGARGLVFNLEAADGAAQLPTQLLGEHNVANLLLVAGVLRALDWDLQRVVRALSTLTPVDGRLQAVQAPGHGAGLPLVVVDYAHTPDALERALHALRPVAAQRGGRLLCVFGCGGGRDTAKRPMMGRVAASLADAVLLTSDNPRHEAPARILDDIAAGMPGLPARREDRAQAILQAVWSAGAGDVVLLAGKGHETTQIFADHVEPFDDREWAAFGLASHGALRLSTDTRSLAPGDWFVALAGERYDGHDYLAVAQQAGAAGAVVARRDDGVALTQLALGDTRRALARIATAWRARHTLPVIAVTGSNGKTTTKEMVASILRAWQADEAVLATRGNLNNDIGVPLTLAGLRPVHRAAVVELGMNHPGEIAGLAAMAQPTVALVNNAQREHQEFMHTVEAVARENGAVLSALPADGVAVFPGDDEYAPLWQALAGARRMMRFGLSPELDVHAADIAAEPDRCGFELRTRAGRARVLLAVPGLHNLRNALAAAACALAAGAPLAAVVRGLEAFRPVAGRLQSRRLADGCLLIDDSYNANADSVRAAIEVLAALPGRRVLVLGDMAEVGDQGPAMHAEVGDYARQHGIDHLLTLGPAAADAARAFGEAAHGFEALAPLLACLAELRPAQVLVKGSRSMKMERVVQALADPATDGKQQQGAAHVA